MTLLDEVFANVSGEHEDIGETLDCFGMTPFHILALSIVPNTKLLHAMRAKYNEPSHDKWGQSPFNDMESNAMWNHLAGRAEWMDSILVPIYKEKLDGDEDALIGKSMIYSALQAALKK